MGGLALGPGHKMMAVEEEDQQETGDQGDGRGWQTPEEKGVEIEMGALADEHILGITDDGRRRADITGDGQTYEKGDGIESGRHQPVDQHRAKGQTGNIISQKGRETGAQEHRGPEKEPRPTQ